MRSTGLRASSGGGTIATGHRGSRVHARTVRLRCHLLAAPSTSRSASPAACFKAVSMRPLNHATVIVTSSGMPPRPASNASVTYRRVSAVRSSRQTNPLLVRVGGGIGQTRTACTGISRRRALATANLRAYKPDSESDTPSTIRPWPLTARRPVAASRQAGSWPEAVAHARLGQQVPRVSGVGFEFAA